MQQRVSQFGERIAAAGLQRIGVPDLIQREIPADRLQIRDRLLVGQDRAIAVALRLEQPANQPLPAVQQFRGVGLLGGEHRLPTPRQRLGGAALVLLQLRLIPQGVGQTALIVHLPGDRGGGGELLRGLRPLRRRSAGQRAAQLADRQQVARLIMAGRQGLGLTGGFGQQGFRRPRIAFPRRKAGLIDQRRRHQRRILRLSGQAQALLPGAAGGGGVTLVGSQVTQMVETGAGNVWSVGLPRQRYAAIQFATGVGGCAHPPQRLAQLA